MFWRSHKPLIMTEQNPNHFFFLEFSAVPLTPINTNSYPKLCVVYTLLNSFATNLLKVPKKKYIVLGSLWKHLLGDCDVCLILLSFQRIQDNFSTAAIAKLFTDYILNAKNTIFETISPFFPFFSFQFFFFSFLPFFFSYSTICVNILQKYTHEFAKKPWPVGMRHVGRKCIVCLIINLRGFREN